MGREYIPSLEERKETEPRFNWYKSDFDYEIWLDPTLAHNLLCLRSDARRSNGDMVLVIVGEEGSGKSQLGRQIGRFLDPTFDERRIEFSPEEAKEAHFKGLPSLSSSEFVPQLYREGKYDGKPWQVIELDESAKLDRKKTTSAGSVEFMGFISQSRQLHKIFIMILPNVHMLDGYIAEHRTLAVIKTEKNKRTNARYYTWYTRKHIKQMFTSDMHKRKLYPARGAFSGTFTNLQPFDITNYERKKAAALQAYKRKEEQTDLGEQLDGANREDIIRTIEEVAVVKCLQNDKLDQPSVYKALNIDRPRWVYLKKMIAKKYGIGTKPMVGPVAAQAKRKEFMGDLRTTSDGGLREKDELDEFTESSYLYESSASTEEK